MSPPPDGPPPAPPPGAGLFPGGLARNFHTGWRQENIGPSHGNQPLMHGWCYPCGEDGGASISYMATFAFGYHVVPRTSPEVDLATDQPDPLEAGVRIRFGSGDEMGIDDEGLELDLGTVVTLNANQTIAADIIYPPVALVAPRFQPRLTIRATVSIGTRGPQGLTTAARRSVRVGTIDGGGNASGIIPIPNVFLPSFAGAGWSVSAFFANSTLTVPTLTLEQYLDGAGAAIVSSVTIGKTDAALVPIRYGARFFRVFNPLGDASANTVLIFPVKF